MKLYLKEGRPQYRDAPGGVCARYVGEQRSMVLFKKLWQQKIRGRLRNGPASESGRQSRSFEVSGHNVLMLKVAVGGQKSATSIKQSARRPLVLGRFEDNGRSAAEVQRYDTNGNSLSDEHNDQGSLNILRWRYRPYPLLQQAFSQLTRGSFTDADEAGKTLLPLVLSLSGHSKYLGMSGRKTLKQLFGNNTQSTVCRPQSPYQTTRRLKSVPVKTL
ncbi:hypothetical protein BDP55DRAFT_639366 [Colletotrichum godetiae]|uniref:Uncharacterized protein n=1 Tax=Colletotrichum godetiae TaxID=1209918 RepID=A0AAJ0EKS2_9PEZI|nr:uncharacterized protein BDP55DRAFT_639366 [Colletotrichum godetiae]KAK1656760.1 hypothetical protein BDP55DRAFT_639366 [Colletotrichum godetiae]